MLHVGQRFGPFQEQRGGTGLTRCLVDITVENIHCAGPDLQTLTPTTFSGTDVHRGQASLGCNVTEPNAGEIERQGFWIGSKIALLRACDMDLGFPLLSVT